MVEYTYQLDAVFGSLSDPNRRDMIKRLSLQSMSIGEVAKYYDFSFAGVAKHLAVLERAGLIHKSRQGKEQIVSIEPKALAAASGFFEEYRQLWEGRLDSLDMYLKSIDTKGKKHGQSDQNR